MNKKISLILIILGIVFTIVGVTISYYIWSSSSEDNTLITFTVSNNFSCSADGGGNITSGDVNLVPTEVNDSTVGNYIKREVKVYPQTVSGVTIYLDLWLTVNSIDLGLSNSTNFMYAFTTGSTSPTDGVVVSSNFNGASAGDKINLLTQKEYASTLTDTYYLWIWLSADESSVDTMNQSFSLSLGGSCADERQLTGAEMLIENANPSTLTYAGATESQKKEMWTFSHDATEQVPATTDYRYIGGGVYCSYESGQYGYSMNSDGTCSERYNYVATRISDGSITTYTNQSSCPSDNINFTYECTKLTLDGIVGVEPNNYITYNDEVWRIIGVFDGRIKIIRDQSIGELMWDYKGEGVGSSIEEGSNDWTDAQLMYMLNPTSYTLKDGYTVTDNMIYDASGNIIYQLGCTPASIAAGATTYSCVANSYSLNETALSQIDEATYYLGGSSSSRGSAELYYTFERGTTVYSGNQTNWTGLVGLMYPSDYVYTFANGVDDTCYTDISNCDTSTPSSSWLYDGVEQWTLSHLSEKNWELFCVAKYGSVDIDDASRSIDVRPVVYLRTDIQLVGTGESTNPYTIVN